MTMSFCVSEKKNRIILEIIFYGRITYRVEKARIFSVVTYNRLRIGRSLRIVG